MPGPFMQKCDLCDGEFQMGAGRYDGKFIPQYQLTVCMTCYQSNWDGWAPLLEGRFIAHLEKKGLPTPARNAKGWFPRE